MSSPALYYKIGGRRLLLNHLLTVLNHYTLEAISNLLTSEVVSCTVLSLSNCYVVDTSFTTASDDELSDKKVCLSL